MESSGSQNSEGAARLANFRLLFAATQLIGLSVVVLMITWVFGYLDGLSWSSNPSVQFNWHPLLNTIGMIYLFGNSILIYRSFRYSRKRNLKLTHGSIFGTIFLFAVIAFWAVYDSHVFATTPIPNFYSLHSWVGAFTMLLFVCQWFIGFVTFMFPQMKGSIKERIMPLHIYFGMGTFVSAVAAVLLGISEKASFHMKGTISSLPAEGVLVNVMGLLILIFAGLVLYLASNQNYKRQPLPEDSILLTGHDE